MRRSLGTAWLTIAVAVLVGACSGGSADDVGSSTTEPSSGGPTLPGDDPGPGIEGDVSLTPDMIRIEGVVTDGTIDAALDEPTGGPFTMQVPSAGGGNGAVITPVNIDGVTKSIVWDGGRTLTLDGPALTFDGRWAVGSGTLTFDLASTVVPLPAGTYTLIGPVAVGDASGLAEPADHVTFASGPETGIGGTGQSGIPVPAGGTLLGPGSFDLHGTFTVTTDSTTVAASTVQLVDNSFELTVTPTGDTISITGLAQGATWA